MVCNTILGEKRLAASRYCNVRAPAMRRSQVLPRRESYTSKQKCQGIKVYYSNCIKAALSSHLEVQIHSFLYQQFHDSVLFVQCGNM